MFDIEGVHVNLLTPGVHVTVVQHVCGSQQCKRPTLQDSLPSLCMVAGHAISVCWITKKGYANSTTG